MTKHQSDIRTHLQKLCLTYPHRCTGSTGNLYATDYFASAGEKLGYEIVKQEFSCIDWEAEEVALSVSDLHFKALPSPWSLGSDCRAELVVLSSVEALREAELKDKVVLLHGAIAKEQLMPKNFVFYNPQEHKELITLLEEKSPAAIISATKKNPEVAGAVYPFPLFEDGDFDIPSVYMTDEEGKKLFEQAGKQVVLKFEATRIPAKGYNILARKGNPTGKKIVVTAHIDTKQGTPGALDNASGVVVMLSMMDKLKDYSGNCCLEFLPMNGEDYYAASGEMKYLAENREDLKHILFNLNIDAPGFKGVRTGFTLMGDNIDFLERITGNLTLNHSFVPIEPWYQGDHMIFVMNGVPALTITSENFAYLCSEIAHTEKDTVDLIDPEMLEEVASALAEVLRKGMDF